MTTSEKQDIARLQRGGMGYRRIAAELGLSVDAVKAYCSRHPVPVERNVCLQCGTPLTQKLHTKKARFCSNHCRSAWWNANREKGLDVGYSYTCPQCGIVFHSPRRNRLYCSRKCYADARRKVVSE